jgi:hypothetical protein
VYRQDFHQGPARITLAGGLSPYGVMGLGGNAFEWEETEGDLVNDNGSSSRGVRGNSWWVNRHYYLSASFRQDHLPTWQNQGIGFRVASLPEQGLVGDFNGNGVLDAGDIDLFCWGPWPPGEPDHDLNDDGLVDKEDHRIWVKELKHTWYGDANLDLEFNSSDMVQVFAAGKYEKEENATWEEGDWDCSLQFDSSDMVTAFADGGYEKRLPMDAEAVPEPASALLLIAGLIVIATCRRRFDP